MTTWILLRGLTREAGHWGRFILDFGAAMGADAVVVAVDLPGNGSLHGQPSPWRVQDLLGACRSQLRQAGHRPPFHVLAMSLGAMVAVEWMQQCPDEVAACVLINTSLRGFSPFYRRLRWRNYGRLLALARVWHQPLRAEALIHRLTSSQPEGRVAAVRDWAALRTQRPVSRPNALRQLAAAALYRPAIAPPSMPVLLLASRGDGLVHCGCSAAIAGAWGCALVLHPASGHDLPLDDPPWVIASVQAWQQELKRPADH
ncbi:alpha/beta hydrolase [Acidovorax sp. FG27]|uniref:alpha/beta fold hydrolase n=1 Tax=Acidovorax sp. FG27 TaxID=3133652 RepID=UPI0030EAFF51